MDFLSNLLPGFPSLDPTSEFQNVTFLQNAFIATFLASLGATTIRNILDQDEPRRYRLESDPKCGLTTGGREECWWTCEEQNSSLVLPSCLARCYPAGHCLTSLVADYQLAGGICQGSIIDLNYPGLWPVSDQPCEFFYNSYGTPFVETGLCSETTKELLSDQENCIHPLYGQKHSIWWTTMNLIRSMCNYQTYSDFYPAAIERKVNMKTKRSITEEKISRLRRQPEHLSEDDEEANDFRLIPIGSISQWNYGVTIATVPTLENTKHRYPWICSLRSVGQQSSHICAVTLLSRPPGPTVLVTSAHCVYICKNLEGRQVPNCCCPNVGPGLCTDTQDCGTNATTVEITGAEAEVKCGEWDTATDTEEEYTVILPIKNIVIHPEFNISRGELNSQFVANDLAIIKVEDRNFEAESRTHNIYPACLPSRNDNHLTTAAVHSGWSKPPPLHYVQTNAYQYEEVYGEFFKQWHHSMVITKCEDPKTHYLTGEPLNYPSNSYYPPGTVCATEIEGEFCPTSGESGSPLMVTDDEGKMVAEGINSFIKGCSAFNFRNFTRTASFLIQSSENPAVYTRLSCFLPWIAAQYDMDYTPPGDPDPACLTGNGDTTEVTAEVCRTNPFGSALDRLDGDGIEAACIFPFTLNGVSHNSCILDELTNFTRPVFRCPIRTVKGVGTNYTDEHITGGDDLNGAFCPTNSVYGYLGSESVVYQWNDEGPVYGPNGELEVDPENNLCNNSERPVFATCKNNCPGVNFPVVGGGFALLATTGNVLAGLGGPAAAAVGAVTLTGVPSVVTGFMPLAAAGAVGILGLTSIMCIGPAFCTTAAGQCCGLLVDGNRGIPICPASC